MGGTSRQQQQTSQNQSSTTAPWEAAQPALQGILGQLNGLIPQSGPNTNQSNALDTIENNSGFFSRAFTPAVSNIANSFLNGGGARDYMPNIQQGYNQFANSTNNQTGNMQAAYNQYAGNTSPLANNTNYDPMQTPGIGDQLQSLRDSITTGVNSQFAASGRDGSGYNQKALGSGLTAGLAPILTNQYNQNVQNQQAAAGNLYNAGNTTAQNQLSAAGNLYNASNTNAGLLSGLQQQYNQNQAQGVGMIPGVNASANSGATATLEAEAQRLGIPTQALGLLAQIGIPIAGLGSQSSGTSTGTSNTTNNMSGAQQFATIGQGLGGFGKFLFG